MHPLLLLGDADVADLLDPATAVDAAELAFRLQGEGRNPPPQMAGVSAADGGFHVKAALLTGDRPFFAAKVNGNFPHNPERHQLPTIQGIVVFADGSTGTPLALLASGALTALRTAAATAVATRHLSADGAATAAIIGCGVQGRAHVAALSVVRRLTRVLAYDTDPERARRFATDMSREHEIEVLAVAKLTDATRSAAIVVTCTTATAPVLGPDDLAPGAFVAAVGADNSKKHEIAPGLMARAAVVCDATAQCASIGDLHHAIAAGAMRQEDVYGELGEIVVGRKPSPAQSGRIVVFDSTGTAMLDVTAAAAVYGRARREGRGTPFSL